MTRALSELRSVNPSPRRGLNREEAALFVGVSTGTFDELVRSGQMPKPLKIGARSIWDVRKLDLAMDALDAEASSWD